METNFPMVLGRPTTKSIVLCFQTYIQELTFIDANLEDFGDHNILIHSLALKPNHTTRIKSRILCLGKHFILFELIQTIILNLFGLDIFN